MICTNNFAEPADSSAGSAPKRRYVDLSQVPLTKRGFYRWDDVIGKPLPFQYDDISGNIYIRSRVNSQYFIVDIPGYCENRCVYIGQIKKCQLASMVGTRLVDYRFKINETIKNLVILDRWRDDKHKYYQCRCTIDNHVFSLREDHITRGVGCPVCSGRVALSGVNDILTLRPDIAQLFVDQSLVTKLKPYANQKVEMRCPRCGQSDWYDVNNVSTRGFSCKYCGDGKSYPNKFVLNMLTQLMDRQQICTEHSFDWSQRVAVSWKPDGKKMIYDIYLPSYNLIIENQGEQHYCDRGFGNLSLVQQNENDQAKMNAAISNGIDVSHYIQLDCQESTLQYIKDAILHSNLPILLGFNEDDIDWNRCDHYASGSILIDVCDAYCQGCTKKKELAEKFHLSRGTVSRYLARGRQLDIVA